VRILPGNVLICAQGGIKLVEELKSGDYVHGMDRKRSFCFSRVVELMPGETVGAYAVYSTSGEAILAENATLPLMSGPKRVGDVAKSPFKQVFRIERLPIFSHLSTDRSCAESGCIARMMHLLHVSHETGDIRFRNPGGLSNAARLSLQVRNGSVRGYEYYMAAVPASWDDAALYHAGECYGFDPLFVFSRDKQVPCQYSAARQAWQLYSRSRGVLPSLIVRPAFGPQTVLLGLKNVQKFDRIEGVQYVGKRASVELELEDAQFAPILGELAPA
jgi:hypothetical protein